MNLNLLKIVRKFFATGMALALITTLDPKGRFQGINIPMDFIASQHLQECISLPYNKCFTLTGGLGIFNPTYSKSIEVFLDGQSILKHEAEKNTLDNGAVVYHTTREIGITFNGDDVRIMFPHNREYVDSEGKNKEIIDLELGNKIKLKSPIFEIPPNADSLDLRIRVTNLFGLTSIYQLSATKDNKDPMLYKISNKELKPIAYEFD